MVYHRKKANLSIIFLSGLFVVGVSVVLIGLGLLHLYKDDFSTDSEHELNKTADYLVSRSYGIDEVQIPFSDEELDQIEQFRKLTEHIVLTQAFMNESTYIIRWIIDKEGDVVLAAKKFQETINWRTENNIDNILEEDYSDVIQRLPFYLNSSTKTGNPVAIVPFGSWELNKVVFSTRTPRLYRNQYYMLEKYARIVQDLSTKNNRVHKLFAIIDFNGFSYRVHGCGRCVTLMISMFKTFETHYPEFVQNWFVINVPNTANYLMGMLLPLLSTRNHAITKIYGLDKSEWGPELLKHIDADQLPKKYV